MAKTAERRMIRVYAHWEGLDEPALMGTLTATPIRGKEVFAFEYDVEWLRQPRAQLLDPHLHLFAGNQYQPETMSNFGVFLDSSPDRWGRLLMRRREAALARQEERRERPLLESDYLLGVFDEHRVGGVRFREAMDGSFLNDNRTMASPPWTSLRELEYASLQLERADAPQDRDYQKWLYLLVAPGSSLGGARPKASVVDPDGHLWIAKFPSQQDDHDIGAWEGVVNDLARAAGVQVTACRVQRFNSRHGTYLSKRFDRTATGERLHFASAMTLLGYHDGTDHHDGASYLDLAGFVMANGAQVAADLAELWRRIVFNICVSNTDDHLRNHGFLLTGQGWRLAPAYDVNPVALGANYGLTLNISATDNALDLDLALEVAPHFRLTPPAARTIRDEVVTAVRGWRAVTARYQLGRDEQEWMAPAFDAAKA